MTSRKKALFDARKGLDPRRCEERTLCNGQGCSRGRAETEWVLIDDEADGGRESLWAACFNGNVEIAKVLVNAGVDVNKTSEDGRGPLWAACFNGHVEIAKLLVNAGADVNKTSKDGRDPLWGACCSGHVKIAELLINAGVDVNKERKDGIVLLWDVCFNGHVKIAKLLINAGADVNQNDEDGRGPLLAASVKGHVKMAKLLLQAGADANNRGKEGRGPLWAACSKGYVEMANILIKAGANIKKRDKDGIGPLWVVCFCGHAKIARLLIDAGANVNKTDRSGKGPLRAVCSYGNVEIAKQLFEPAADINKTDRRGLSWAAFSNGHEEIAKLLIIAGADANQADEFERGPMWAACSNGHVEIVELMINAGADANKTDRYEQVPLSKACSKGYVKIVQLLLNAGAVVNLTDTHGKWPLLLACSNGHVEIAEALINAGADAEKWHLDGGPLLEACFNGHVEIVKLLLRGRVDVNTTFGVGKWPLWAACSNGHGRITKLLIDFGADANKADEFGRNSFWAACANGHVEVVKILIDAGADVNMTDECKRGPLWAACSRGHVELAKLLIDAGADVNMRDRDGKLLWSACSIDHAELTKLLIDAGTGWEGRGPLFEAFCRGHVSIAKLLIDAGIDIDKTSKFGNWPLWNACSNDHVEIAKLLIEAKADVNKTNKYGRGPLWNACCNGYVNIVKLLIEAKADVNMTDTSGKGPLWTACSSGHLIIVKLLIEAGAKVDKTDMHKRGPLWKACCKGHVEIVKLLICAGADVSTIDMDDLFAFFELCEIDSADVAVALIDAGASIPQKAELFHPVLMKACEKGNAEAVKRLIDAGCDVNKADKYGRLALLAACENSQVAISKLLIDSGAHVSSTDTQRNSLLHIIAKCSNGKPGISGCGHVDLLKAILSKDPSLIDQANKNGLLAHEIPCFSDVRQFLFESWTMYRYNELYSRGTTKPEKCKVCVIGEARAGKTTLIKTLRNIDWRNGGDDRRTASIDIFIANLQSAGQLVFCDFAGQPFFHKTHGLFFTESTTVFILVADLTKRDMDLKVSSHYFCSFVKCSTVFSGKAHILVVGSKRDKLSNFENGQSRLRQLVTYLRLTFKRWFNFYEDLFVLNCRDRKSITLDLLRKAVGKVKALAIKAAKDVPIIVEDAMTLFLPTLRNQFRKRSPWKTTLSRFLSSTVTSAEENVSAKTLSALKRNGLISEIEQETWKGLRFINASVFKQLISDCIYPGLTNEVQNLLVEFLQGVGEIFAIEDKIILDPSWLFQNAIGPLLSPPDFPVHLHCSSSGTATKKDIQCALEAFNQRWEDVDETISLLCHLEVCYPVPAKSDMYLFPALIEEKRPPEVWLANYKMTVYVGRRISRLEETDIITPGIMPFLQCRIHNDPSFRGLEPVIWQGGLMIKATIDDVSVEGMITLHQKSKALDFVVRGPRHSERECMKLLNTLRRTGIKLLGEKSPGMDSCLSYISCTELKQLKVDSPLAYTKAKIDEKIKTSTKSSASVSEGTIEDSLKDLLALPDNHFYFLSYRNRRAIQKCLEKDEEGKKALAKKLKGLSIVDVVESESAETLISLWSENLHATAKCFSDSARQASLLYLLALLHSDGAIELSAEEKEIAEEDLDFIQENSPSAIREKRLAGQVAANLTASSPQKAAALKEQDKELVGLFDDNYLDTPVTSRERFEASRRIQPIWKQIGRILEPEPYEHYDLHDFGDKKRDREAALTMLDAWADKVGTRATRRNLIDAMKYVGYLKEIAEIFQGYLSEVEH